MHTGIKYSRQKCVQQNDRAGAALVTILVVSLLLMTAGVTMVVLSNQSMHRIKRTVSVAQAQAVAEAGIADMVAKLGSNYTAWQNASNVATFLDNGTYHVTTRQQPNGNVLIISDGLHMSFSNRTIMELLGTTQTHLNELFNLNSAIMSDGDIRISTAAYTVNGDLHANQDVIANGGAKNGTINGDISAGGTIGTFNNVSGTTTSGVPRITLPPSGPFNFDSYRQLAINNGVYLEGNQSLRGKPIATAPNGIMYVNGDLTIGNQSAYSGTIVVNGNISIANHFVHSAFAGASNMPSLLSTGTITLQNNCTLNGVVFAQVNVSIQNNVTINGGVISLGYTEIQNCSTITHGTAYPAWDPLNPAVPPEVIVGGWLK